MIVTASASGAGGFVTNVNMIAGETLALAATITNQLTGAAINLTGYSLKATINFPTPVELTTANGGITLPYPSLGQLQLNASSSSTADWDGGTYAWDLWMVSGAGVETPLLRGSWNVELSISPVP
jgi:hypothetical protein